MPIDMIRIDPDDYAAVRRAMQLLLADPGQGPTSADLAAQFLRSISESKIELSLFGVSRGPAFVGVAAALVLPGRTGILMIAAAGQNGILAAESGRAAHAAIDALDLRSLHYIQCLIETNHVENRRFLEAAGFSHLTTLVYMRRSAVYPWVEEPDSRFQWRVGGDGPDSALSETLVRTYEDSQDCPELLGVRPIADVLASHRASGTYDPELWEIVLVDGVRVGCLLLTDQIASRALEIVYLGVVPEFRRRGIGAALLRRAVSVARARRAQEVLVVVDAHNVAALELYSQFAFEPVAQREAWWRRRRED